ncbi:MAG: T9SS type A sorting domain-containing protein [Ignavibacteria bacterium]|nr:T9SS type A sorting domain-containing protein [Ignavibacteria bacterium]
MKRLAVCILLFASVLSYAQNANTFFPPAPGYKWYYKNTPLDTLNNPQETASTYRIDSFAFNGNYKGLEASIVYSKQRLLTINQPSPYTDTAYHNFQTTNGWEYLQFGNLDSIPFISQLGLVNFFKGLEGWYSTYRYAQTVNSTYNLFSKDTSIVYNGTTYPLRFKTDGKRLNDETVSTINGNYLSKKFIVTVNLSYLLTVPPLPPVPISILNRPDTVWIASNVWIVKEAAPTQIVDLSNLGQAVRFAFPGEIVTLTFPPSAIEPVSSEIPAGYSLRQNYPNPFNPSTKISFDIPASSHVNLSVYNMLGKEVETLVNENLKAGKYEVSFNGSSLSSGTYYYKLTAGKFTISKVMTLIK